MSQMNLNVSPGLVRATSGYDQGPSMCFAPLNVAAYLYTPIELRGLSVIRYQFIATRLEAGIEESRGSSWRDWCASPRAIDME